ncbi:MAG TPA: ATP-binding protein [Gammaproteobacteria bacterium]|nr:ATP-binding protein [Gammaproteobacteria bacterium]
MRGDETNFRISAAITCSEDVVVARQRGRTLARAMGFSPSDATLVAAAISELARNIVKYADRGELLIGKDDDGMLFVVARDDGPGIADVESAMQPGYSTSGGLGMGLPGVKRIADSFEIVSNSHGTTVTMRKRKR